jgi:hypothetical protein
MWIQIKRTDKELYPAHAHLYRPVKTVRRRSLITKFLISEIAPKEPSDIAVFPGRPPMPPKYALMIIQWAKDNNELGINNWISLLHDRDGLEKTFR